MSTIKQKWVDVEHPDFVNFYKKLAQDPNEDPLIVEFAKAKLESYVYEDPNCHIRASPLFEVSSIKISKDLFESIDKKEGYSGFSCAIEVYGHIRLIDDKGNMFTLFKLDYKNAKKVILEDSLSIILRKPQLSTPRRLPKNLKLHILLKDRIRDVVFFDDSKFFSFSREVDYDVLQYCTLDYNIQQIQPKSSTLEMGFITFHCAVLAYVGVTLVRVGNDQLDTHLDMKMKLKALIKLRNSEVCHELFDDNPSKLEFEAANELCVLAVPVYSPLKIIARFEFGGKELNVTELDFNPRGKQYKSVEKIEGQSFQMLVSVTWAHAKKLPENYLREWDDAPSSSDSDSEIEEFARSQFDKQKRIEHMEETSGGIGYFIQPQLQALCDREWFSSHRPDEFVELFCVSICSFDGASSITGTISTYQAHIIWDYFSGKEKKTGILYPHVTRGCLMGPNFHMELDLEDVKGHQISRGYLDYDDRNVEAWYNRRVCSIVLGKRGYAAAYYTIFEDAKEARLNIRLMPENGVAVCLCGTIHARYSNFKYSTKYDKDYFQSTIFEKGKSELVEGGDEVPLTKSMVAVPRIASLIVKVDLRVLLDDKHVETIRGKATFRPRDIEDPKELKVISGLKSSSTYCLSVSVEWDPS